MHHSIHTREVEWNDDNDGEPEQEEVAGLPRLGSVWIGRGGKCGESSVAQDMLKFDHPLASFPDLPTCLLVFTGFDHLQHAEARKVWGRRYYPPVLQLLLSGDALLTSWSCMSCCCSRMRVGSRSATSWENQRTTTFGPRTLDTRYR